MRSISMLILAGLSLLTPGGGMARPALAAQVGAPELVYCAALSAPPLGYLDENAKPAGLDVELGNEIATRLERDPKWLIVPFKGIIPALLAGQCDAILSQLFDKPERREVIDIIDFMNSSEALLVRAGNPRKIAGLADLSGLKVAVNTGTTIQVWLDKRTPPSQPPAVIVPLPKDTDALQQLEIGQADVYGTTLETAAYYMTKAPGTFEVAGPPFARILTGIGLRKDEAELGRDLTRVLAAMRADGSYARIFTKWHLEDDMLP
jgi:polar amino acid transport system substrate-binding protein